VAGDKHALKVTRALRGVAKSVKVICLFDKAERDEEGRAPDERKDLTNWIDKTGGTKAALLALIEATEEHTGPANDHADEIAGEEVEIERLIREGPSEVEVVWKVINALLRYGYNPAAVSAVLLNKANGISALIYEQWDPNAYARKQVKNAIDKIELSTDQDGKPYKSQNNVRIALLKLGVRLRYDEFSDRMLIEGLPDFGPALDDAAVNRMWLTMEQRFRLAVAKDWFFTVVEDTARRNKFHPVRDYLNGLQWDGTPRLDSWLVKYGEAEDNEYTRAVGALMLVAAVRRVRKPGCKFDEMLVLEQPTQGTEKSTVMRMLAVNDEWFTDDMPLNADGKRVIEAIRGKWIIECAELSGMRRSDVEHVKALLSRQSDRARLAYGRITTEVQRQGIFVGTTNALEYLCAHRVIPSTCTD
jgi:hypothetical protein